MSSLRNYTTYEFSPWEGNISCVATHQREGEYALALDSFRFTLEEATVLFGQGDRSLHCAEVMCRGAVLYQAIGEKAKAFQYLKYCVHIWEIRYGPDYSNVARELNELAERYRGQGDNAMSDLALWGLLAIGEKKLGSGHPDLQLLYGTVYPTIKKYEDTQDLQAKASTGGSGCLVVLACLAIPTALILCLL